MRQIIIFQDEVVHLVVKAIYAQRHKFLKINKINTKIK
jgi:hypothetical protein